MLPTPVPPVTPAVIVAGFTPATHDWLPAHRGVDFAVTAGQPVYAVRAGTVVLARIIADRPVVVLRSRGIRFTFEPVTTSRKVGERLRTGERLGTVAAGGHCGASCLHWGARADGVYLDPLSFLTRDSPILKPVRG